MRKLFLLKISIQNTYHFGKSNLKKGNIRKKRKTAQPKKYEEEYIEKGKYDWYIQWRKNNI